jgi:PKD repeat protein
MKSMKYLSLTFAVLALLFSGCKDDDEPTLGEAPSDADAQFTYEATADNDNIIRFTAANSSLNAKWDFGNGTTGEGSVVEASYPNKGTYTVTLTVFNSGGSNSSSQEVVIAEDDPSLLNNPLYTLLTGGTAGGGSKTWVVDSTRAGHMGVGPVAGTWPEWWSAGRLDKSGSGLYSDEYTFHLQGFAFDHVTNGLVFLNDDQMSEFSGSYANADDASAPLSDQIGESWTLVEGDNDTTITISGQAFLGFFAGTRTYRVETLTENELTISYEDSKDATLRWWIRLVPDDYPTDGGGGGGTDPKFELPIDFESGTTEWNTFGNSTYEIKDNPFPGGINTSSKVLETVHGNETWAGLYVDLKDPLDFSGADSMISVMVYAPQTGTMRVKIENSGNTNDFEERDVEVTKANEWVEVAVGFSTAAVDSYDRLVLFPGWDVANAGTFYLDDIKQK